MKIKKLLSLVSAAAISVSCFAGMAVTASAEGDYVEWTVIGTSRKNVSPGYELMTQSESLKTTPTFEVVDDTFNEVQRFKAAADFDFTKVSGSAMTISSIPTENQYALKLGATNGSVNINNILPNQDSYGSYDVTVVYSLRYAGQQGLTITANDGKTYTDQYDNGSEQAYNVKSYTVPNLRSNNLNFKRSNSEVELLYIGIKYNPPVASTVDVSDVEVFDNPDKTSEATVFNAMVYANDFAVTGLKFENNDEKKETTEIAKGSTALFVVVYEGLATANPVVTPIN